MIVRGDIIFNKESKKFTIYEDSYLIIDKEGKIDKIVKSLKEGEG